MSDTVRVTEVLKKKLSSVPEVEEGDLKTEDILIGLKTDDNKKTVQIPVSVLLDLIDTELLTDIKRRLDLLESAAPGKRRWRYAYHGPGRAGARRFRFPGSGERCPALSMAPGRRSAGIPEGCRAGASQAESGDRLSGYPVDIRADRDR